MSELKFCPKCKLEKPLNEFSNHKATRDGKRSYCKACTVLASKETRARHPDTVSKLKQRYRFKNKDKINERQNIKRKQRKFKSMVHRANSTSRLKYTGETITAFQLFCLAKKQKLKCAISGVKLTNENISLDHIIPYSNGGKNSIENIQLIDYDINIMKNSHNQDDFLKLIGLIFDYQQKKNPPC